MPNFDFSNEEILSIIAFIRQETLNPPQPAAAAGPAAAGGEAAATGISRQYLVAILAGLIVILVLILVVLLLLVSTLTKYLQQKPGLEEDEKEILGQRLDWQKLIRSPGFVFVVVFIFITLLAKAGIDGLYSIGIQQGYEPVQPIAFSHKLHAGQYEIECQYCHTGVMTSRSANIPSANICMNCHGQIMVMTGQTEKSVEIQKIHDAVQNDKPIEWIRVHNLPDLAYFNHAQHYNVGGITCQTCHGPVETMDVVRQYNTLTMGWCIDCHRKTAIKSKTPMVVQDIGGIECSKCHY
jgi:hypothetical protein